MPRVNKSQIFAEAASAFGAAARQKLSDPAITGSPEEQLRKPLEDFIRAVAPALIPACSVNVVGETTLEGGVRPDFAVSVNRALMGFIELKAPGKGPNPNALRDDHDKKQWEKLKKLPNLIYTDGNGFSLWRDGKQIGDTAELEGDIKTAGRKLAAPPALEGLLRDFLTWSPTAPKSAKQLAQISARLCSLLRGYVAEELARKNPGFDALASEWRNLLFPEADDKTFADGYAQAVTFGLLVARVRGIELDAKLSTASEALRETSTLIGTALRLLVDDPSVRKPLESILGTLTRVLNAVNWADIAKGDADAWLYFYEDFLDIYDRDLRKMTGSYYTPPEVVNAMVRLTDEALRSPALFNRPLGLADRNVTICDPAAGTGTFMLGVLRRVAETAAADQGPGAAPGQIAAAAERMFGFELQFGPFAVAQLRIIAELQTLMNGAAPPTPKLYITDTLGDPYAAEAQFSSMVAAIGESRKAANRIKRETPITVVIGNPPYKNKAEGKGGWIEDGSKGRAAPMDWWYPPAEWRVGAHTHHLKNLYVYFWRWAAWKVFGSGVAASTGEKETDRSGVVCFITVAGFLNGPGFQKMREELRRDCSDIWVIDCSPEGFRPTQSKRIFQGVKHEVCIVLAARNPKKDRARPAKIRFATLPLGNRNDKFAALDKLSLQSADWGVGATGWREPLLPEQRGMWPSFLALSDFLVWYGPGLTAQRTWPIAPDVQSLEKRWTTLQRSSDKEKLFDPCDDRDVTRIVRPPMGEFVTRSSCIADDAASVVTPTQYSFRSFDKQYIIPDNRLISRSRPRLWENYSPKQIFLTALDDISSESGPACTFCAFIPDKHHYHGRGGRVYPLWANAAATEPNIRPALLARLAETYGATVSPEDMMAYIAALLAHPAFTARFKADLIRPGLRVPVTASAALFSRAAALGREVIWLHTYGERFADPAAGRQFGPPRLKGGPTIPRDGAIPGAPEPLPDTMHYDAAKQRLHIGLGFIDNVPQAVWDYEVSGMNVLRQWFSYRKRDRTRPIIGDRRPPSPLAFIQPDHWLPEYTTDLIDLLHVLCRVVALEPAQAALLDEVLANKLISASDLSPPVEN
jgi:hypothetical protein